MLQAVLWVWPSYLLHQRWITDKSHTGQDCCCPIGEGQDPLTNLSFSFCAIFHPLEWFNQGYKIHSKVLWYTRALQRPLSKLGPRFPICWYQLSCIWTVPDSDHRVSRDRNIVASISVWEHGRCNLYLCHISSWTDPHASCLWNSPEESLILALYISENLLRRQPGLVKLLSSNFANYARHTSLRWNIILNAWSNQGLVALTFPCTIYSGSRLFYQVDRNCPALLWSSRWDSRSNCVLPNRYNSAANTSWECGWCQIRHFWDSKTYFPGERHKGVLCWADHWLCQNGSHGGNQFLCIWSNEAVYGYFSIAMFCLFSIKCLKSISLWVLRIMACVVIENQRSRFQPRVFLDTRPYALKEVVFSGQGAQNGNAADWGRYGSVTDWELNLLVGDERLTRKMGQYMGCHEADYFIIFQFSMWHFFHSVQTPIWTDSINLKFRVFD